MPSGRFPPNPRSIFCTNVNGTGDDVMIFTSLDVETLKRAHANAPADRRVTYDECYEVPDKDIGTYIYEPCWLTLEQETHARTLASLTPA